MPSILNKIFGNPEPPKNWPELQAAWAKQQINDPNAVNNVTSVGEMGPLMKWFNPDTYGASNPIMGSVSLNRDMLQNPEDLDATLTHEMVHAGQGVPGFLKMFYDRSAAENPAINKEAMRRIPRDVHLRSEKRR